MQIHFESGTLNPPPLALRLPRRTLGNSTRCCRPTVGAPSTALLAARQEALRAGIYEQVVWLGLAVAALALVLVSFAV